MSLATVRCITPAYARTESPSHVSHAEGASSLATIQFHVGDAQGYSDPLNAFTTLRRQLPRRLRNDGKCLKQQTF